MASASSAFWGVLEQASDRHIACEFGGSMVGGVPVL